MYALGDRSLVDAAMDKIIVRFTAAPLQASTSTASEGHESGSARPSSLRSRVAYCIRRWRADLAERCCEMDFCALRVMRRMVCLPEDIGALAVWSCPAAVAAAAKALFCATIRLTRPVAAC